MLETIQERFDLNIRRVENLIAAYGKLRGTGKGRRKLSQTDVLRSAVVLLHATLEDFLRGLERWKLPGASADRLNKLPLGPQEGRAEAFTWSDLLKHRTKKIYALLIESIEFYLDRSNYNEVKEVVAVLQLVGVDKVKVEKYFPEMEAAMQRRHAIVHQADRQNKAGKGFGKTQPIDEVLVESWISAVRRFCRRVVKELA